MKNKPVKTYRAGACSASVFANDIKTEGVARTFLTVAFSCRYHDDATGEWKDATSMTANELARAIVVLQKAYEHCVLQESRTE